MGFWRPEQPGQTGYLLGRLAEKTKLSHKNEGSCQKRSVSKRLCAGFDIRGATDER